MLSQRPYSIRTRIKTLRFPRQSNVLPVRDHIPLEQGLRPQEIASLTQNRRVRDHIPLEQGLRHLPLLFQYRMLLLSETIFH